MNKILTGAVAVLALGGALSAAALPAAAEDHRGGGWHGDRGEHDGWRGDHDGWRGDRGYGYGASAALLGLGVGAALAGGYYGSGYYAPPAYYAVPRCRVEARWNPYWGGYERVRVCY